MDSFDSVLALYLRRSLLKSLIVQLVFSDSPCAIMLRVGATGRARTTQQPAQAYSVANQHAARAQRSSRQRSISSNRVVWVKAAPEAAGELQSSYDAVVVGAGASGLVAAKHMQSQGSTLS